MTSSQRIKLPLNLASSVLYVNWLSFNYRDKKKSVCLQEHRHLVSLRSDLARLECRLEKDLCVGHGREALQTGMTISFGEVTPAKG